ncbi:MAG: 50S ribosomal protein L4, partial [Candidatus Pacebacteria bacterium]|nr:50S ribosomal protein L4 [Candidatus Paceibacterota bacterium]
VNEIVVSDEIMSLSGKTKEAISLMAKLAPQSSKVLIIINETKAEVLRSLRNIETVLVVSASRVNALEIAMADTIIATSDAIKTIEDRLDFTKDVKRVKKVKPEAEEVKKVVKKAAKVAAK